MLTTIRTVAIAAGLCLAASPVLAQQGVTKDEVKCESGAGKALTKFVGAKGKCATKCLATQRKAAVPNYASCFPPFADPAMNTCILDPVKGAEAKARAAIIKACTKDCPECYADNTPNTCTTGEPFVMTTETNLDAFESLVYCLEAASTTPTKEQAKCEDTVSKTLAKFVASKSKCYDKCFQNIFNGKIPDGTCTPPASDPATQACIQKAEDKAVAGIDKTCSGVAGANPPCYTPATDTGAEWVAITEAAVDAQTPQVACGSPSGAFLD